jgi:hypothetical protein
VRRPSKRCALLNLAQSSLGRIAHAMAFSKANQQPIRPHPLCTSSYRDTAMASKCNPIIWCPFVRMHLRHHWVSLSVVLTPRPIPPRLHSRVRGFGLASLFKPVPTPLAAGWETMSCDHSLILCQHPPCRTHRCPSHPHSSIAPDYLVPGNLRLAYIHARSIS